jgi:DnaK suppressor protein
VLAAERADTLARIRAMSTDLREIVEASHDANADDEHDPEGSTIAFERAQVTALLDQARRHLDQLDQAAARLAAGTYWTCTVCGGEITTERLVARPSARTCVACAASGHH